MTAPKKEDFQIIFIEILIMKHEKYMSLQSIDFEFIFVIITDFFHQALYYTNMNIDHLKTSYLYP